MSYANLVLNTSSVIAYLIENEISSATIAVDATGSGNNAAITGATPSAVLGIVGAPTTNAYQFHASTDNLLVTVPVSWPTGNAAFTIATWVDVTSAASLGAIASWGNLSTEGVELSVPNATTIRCVFFGSTLNATVASITGSFHYIAVTWDGTLRTIYLDGVLVAQDSPGVQALTATNVLVGANALHPAITGYQCQYEVHNAALSAATLLGRFRDGGTRKVLIDNVLTNFSSSPVVGANVVLQLLIPNNTTAFGATGIGALAGLKIAPINLNDRTDTSGSWQQDLLAPQDIVPDQFQGAWSSLTSYVLNDVVLSGGLWYRATAPNLNDVPPSVNWKLQPFFSYLLTENSEVHSTTNFAYVTTAISAPTVYASAPAGPPTCQMVGHVFRPDATALAGNVITATLSGRGVVNGITIAGGTQFFATEDSSGNYTLTVVPTDVMSPGTLAYYVTEYPGAPVITIVAPSSGGLVDSNITLAVAGGPAFVSAPTLSMVLAAASDYASKTFI